MIQLVTENTRFRGEDKPSKLDLLFTKRINLETDINYECPFGRSDHVVLEIEIKEDIKETGGIIQKEKELCKRKLYCNEEVFQLN